MLCRQDMRGDWKWIYGNIEPGQCLAVHRVVYGMGVGGYRDFQSTFGCGAEVDKACLPTCEGADRTWLVL